MMDVQVPTEIGFIFASENAGIVRNRGIEVKLYSVPVKTRDVSWDFNLIFTKIPASLRPFLIGYSPSGFGSGSTRKVKQQGVEEMGIVGGIKVCAGRKGRI